MKYSILILIVMMLFSCRSQKQNIVAEVNNEQLSLERFMTNFTTEEWNVMSKKEKQAYLEQWVVLTLLAQESDRKKIVETEPIQMRIENSVKKLKANAFIAHELANLSVTEEEIFDFFKANQNLFQEQVKQYHMQRILVKEASKLDFVRQEIADKSFADAAKTHSDENLGRNGGILGWVSQEGIDAVFWNALEELNRMYYRTIHTPNGYYIIRYTDSRTTERSKHFLDVREEAENMLLEIKRDELYESLVYQLRKKAEIFISI